MKTVNPAFAYPGMELWDDASWADRRAPMDEIALTEAALELEACPELPDPYADRSDETNQGTGFVWYFADVVEEWRRKGLVLVCKGMMGITLAPVSVVERRRKDVRVLIIPRFLDTHGNRHAVMDLLYAHQELLEACAREEILVQFLTMRLGEGTGILQERGVETPGYFRIAYQDVWLYVDAAARRGLDQISSYSEAVYGRPELLAGRWILNVSHQWQPRLAHQYSISHGYRNFMKDWDYQKHIHSEVGQRQAESMRLEHDFQDGNDPALADFWRRMGLRYENHLLGDDPWFSLTPECVFDHPDRKIPVLCVLKESRACIPFMSLTAMQFYYDFAKIAASGEFMMIFFALETPDDNEAWIPLLDDAEKLYPIDRTRLYMTGQSHNGYMTTEFYRRHPELLAAAATISDPMGLQVGGNVEGYDTEPDRIVDSFRGHDCPLINLNGQLENKLYTAEPGSPLHREQAEYFRRRLLAFRCRERSVEEIMAARASEDYTTRMNAIPADRTETRYVLGNEAYVSDLQNEQGRWHLRFVSYENLPHMIAPQMAEMAWEFMRRFARDPETGAVVELY